MPDPQQEKWQTIDIPWPTKGIATNAAYGKQEPETTPDCLNVINLDARSNRMRGGTRPGLTRVIGSLDNGNAIQCLYQADASTISLSSGPSNQTIATSTTQSTAANPSPTDQPATSQASSTDFAGTGNGALVVPAQGAGYYMLTPSTSNTTVTKSSLLGGGNTYQGSCWRQNGHAVILSSVPNSGGSSTLSSDLFSSLTSTGTLIQVANGAIFKTPDGTSLTNFVVQIEQEQIRIASVSGNNLTVATSGRGFNSTQAAEHAQGVGVSFYLQTTLTADLSAGIANGDTTLTVSSVAPLYPAVPYTVQVENELMRVTAVTGTDLTVTRGAHGTTGTVGHAAGKPVVLYGRDTLATALSSGISSSDATIVVADASQMPSAGTFCINIESETIKVASRSGNTLTVTGGRGFNGTTAVSHAAGVTISSSSAALAAACYSGINTSATTFTVASTSPFPFTSTGSFKVMLGGELVTVGASGVNTTTRTLTVTRNASPSRHPYGEVVYPYATTTVNADCLSGIGTTTTAGTTGITASPTLAAMTYLPTAGTYSVKIDNEVVYVAAFSGTTLTSVTRAQNSTTAAAHATGATVTLWGVGATSTAVTATQGAGTTFTMSSLTVANLFPSSGQFVVQIDSERILVTRTAGTATFSVVTRGYTGGGAAAAHTSGATVTLIASGSTTLTNTGATTLTVASTSITAGFPTAGSFWIRVGTEKMQVTSIASATVFNVTRTIANGATNHLSASAEAVTLDAATYGTTTLTNIGDTSITVDNAYLLPSVAGSGYQIQVEGETMTVTALNAAVNNVVTVTRSTTPADHATVGATVALKTAASTTLTPSPSSSVVISQAVSSSTLPTTAPYTIIVDRGTANEEQMTVTAVSGSTLTVTRGVNGTWPPKDHSDSPAAVVEIWGSVGTSTVAGTGATTMTVANAAMFPFSPTSPGSVTGLSYQVLVEQTELVTVTGINTSTNVVTITRSIADGASNHTSGATVTRAFSVTSTVTNAGGTTVAVSSASSFPSSSLVPYTILVDSEQMQVTAVSGNSFTVTRGFNGTAVATHATGRPVTQVGAAQSQQLQYEVRDQFGAAVKALTNLMVVTTGSQVYGMAAQEQPSGSNNFVWIWAGSIKSLTDTFTGFDPAATANVGRECVLKYSISAAGTLSATTSALSATTSGVIASSNSTHPTRLVNGMSQVAYAPRHGGMAIVPGTNGSTLTLTEVGQYVTADSNFVGTRLVSYSTDTGAVQGQQLVALPSSTYTTGPVVGVPQQIVATGTRLSGAKYLLAELMDGPGANDGTKVTSVRSNTFPVGVSAPASVTTTVGSTSQVHVSPEEVKLTESAIGSGSDTWTSVAYNPVTNRALAVRRKRGDGSGNTAETYTMAYQGAATGGGFVTGASPMSGISLEWCAPAPWGWIVAGVTSTGTTDVVALSHNLTTLNDDATSMWTSSIGWTATSAIKAPSVNFVRLADYTSGTMPATPTKSVLFSDTTKTMTERESQSFTVKLTSAPLGNVTISFTSSDTNVATVSPSSLTLTSANWSSPQTVTVSGVAGTGTRTATITATISSTADSDYNSIPTLPSVSLTVTDADAGVLYGENRTTFTIKEGASVFLPVRLRAQPSANVVLTFASSDSGQLAVSPATMTFTSSNYATDQLLTMTGVVDAVSEGSIAYTVAVSSASSDAAYNPPFDPTDLTVTVENGSPPTTRILSRLAIAGGKLFEVSRCTTTNTTLFSRIGTATFTSSDVVRAANLGVRVFFADGVSQLEYNASEGVLKTFTPTAGQFPTVSGKKPKIVEVWRDRLWFAGIESDPQNYFCSRLQDPGDLNYRNTQDTVNTPQDVNAAQKGNFSAAGLFPGGTLNGIVPYNSDIAVFGGDRGLFQMAGDPGAGAVFDEITNSTGVGMAFGRAWCKDPLGQVYFWGSTGGIYRLRLNTPSQIMTDRFTTMGVERMTSVNLDAYVATLKWDQYLQGVHVWLTPYSLSGTSYYAFFDAATEGWFPLRLAGSATSTMHPLCAEVFDGDQSNDRYIITGGRDGICRKIDPAATTDDGTAFSSYVVMGPFAQPPAYAVMNSVQADQTGFTLTALAGETPAAALASSGRSLGTLGSNKIARQRIRGRSIYVKASVSSGAAALDRVSAEMGTVRG